MSQLAKPMPKPTAQVAPYVEALGAELAVTFLLANGGCEIYRGTGPKGQSRLAAMVGHDRALALAQHPAMQMKQRVPLASRWLTLMLHWQGHSTAEIARRVRIADSTARRWIREGQQ